MRDLSSCSFCNEIQGIEENNFFIKYLLEAFASKNIRTRIVGETSNFLVMPMIGPLVEGYLLIVPKIHYESFSQLSKGLLIEAQQIILELKKIFSIYYGPSIVYEHGAFNNTFRGGCCSDHAHLHIVSVNCDVSDEFNRYNMKVRHIESLCGLTKQNSRESAYLLYQNQNAVTMVMDVDVIESQFIRKLLAKRMDLPDRAYWDANPRTEWIASIIGKVKPEIDRQKNNGLWI